MDTASGSGSNMNMYLKKVLAYNSPALTVSNLAQQTNVIKKTFTVDKPVYTTIIYPKVAVPVYTGTGTTQTYKFQKSGWISTTNPILHYGLDMINTGTDATEYFIINVSYNLSFRYQI